MALSGVFFSPMRPLFIALCLALTLLLLPLSARADSGTLQVLAIASPDSFENAKALTIALKRAVTRADDWSLSSGEFSLEVLMAGFDCAEPPDDECLSQVAGSVGSSRFIWGTLSEAGDDVVAHLRFWEDGRNVRETELVFAASLTDPSDGALSKLAEDAFFELLGASTGTLVVRAGNANGEVFISGTPRGKLIDGRAKLLVPSGNLQVEVKANGYRTVRRTVVMRPGAKADLAFDLVPLARAATDDRRRVGAQKLVGYGAVGVGSVVAVVGGVYWVSSYQQMKDDDYEAYREYVPQNTDPCVAARNDSGQPATPGKPDPRGIVDHCDKNRTTRTLARVLTPAGAILAVAGAVLVATDKPNRERVAKRQVRPSVAFGPRGGQLDLSIRF